LNDYRFKLPDDDNDVLATSLIGIEAGRNGTPSGASIGRVTLCNSNVVATALSGTWPLDRNLVSDDEEARLAELYRRDILDTEPERDFDRITELVSAIFDVPISTVTLVDRDRQWFKSAKGIAILETPRCDSFCAHAVGFDEPLVVRDAELDGRFCDNPYVKADPRIKFYMGVPLKTAKGFNIGALCAMDTQSRRASAKEVEILQNLAEIVVAQLELRAVASIDGLTGAMRRAPFLSQVRRDLARARRAGTPSSCLMLDFDHFKAINDTHGHATGDRVLKTVAAAAQHVLRAGDYMGRLGGEEFAVFLADTTVEQALQVAERLRLTIGQSAISTGWVTITVTASIGVATTATNDVKAEALISRADQALYLAKASGRNRCEALS
jgi:diguanylate cyclase (GGDEF)-like protein